MGRFTGFLGLAVILGVAWLFSTHKKEIKLRLILWGMGLAVRVCGAGVEDGLRPDLQDESATV